MFEDYHLCQKPRIITASVPGEKSLALLKVQDELESNNRSYPRGIPLAFDSAKGAIIQDVDGNRFLDFFAGAGVLNLGHNNPDIIKDLEGQRDKIQQTLDYPTNTKIEFMKLLLERVSNTLQSKCKINFGGPTGSDAVEAALKLAKINTQRHSIIAFQGGYHGMSMGALSITSRLAHRSLISPLIPDVHFMPYSYCYRCPLGREAETCKIECAQYLKNSLGNPHSGIEKPAAIIVEPVQGEGGTIVPKEGWLAEITGIARDNGILVIYDEIQSGFYRTGPFLSFENFSAKPDIITMSKGIGGIGYPLSLIVYKEKFDIWEPGTHIGTFRGNQIALAAGLSAMTLAKKLNLEHYVKELGNEILDILKKIQKRSKFIGDVRGIGMMFGIEYVEDKKSKIPFAEMAKRVRESCYKNGLLVELGGCYDNVIRFLPPLILTKKMAMNGLSIFEKSNSLIAKEYRT